MLMLMLILVSLNVYLVHSQAICSRCSHRKVKCEDDFHGQRIPRTSIIATSKVLQKSPIIIPPPHAYEDGEGELVASWDSYLALRLRLGDRNEEEDEEEDELEDEPEAFSDFSEEAASFLVTEVLKLISSGTEEVDRPGLGKVMR